MYLIAIDRDNTLIEDPGYLGKEDDWKEHLKLLPEVVEGLKVLRKLDAKIIVASNQSGIARELYTKQRSQEVCDAIAEMLEKEGIVLDGWYFSTYVTEEYGKKNKVKEKWIRDDGMRKPGTGMLELGAKDNGLDWEKLVKERRIFMIGDKDEDMQAGINAKGNPVYVPAKITRKEHEFRIRKLKEKHPEIYIASGFLDACTWIKKKIS